MSSLHPSQQVSALFDLVNSTGWQVLMDLLQQNELYPLQSELCHAEQEHLSDYYRLQERYRTLEQLAHLPRKYLISIKEGLEEGGTPE